VATPNGAAVTQVDWAWLWRALVPPLRLMVRSHHAAEDIAGEAVAWVWKKLGPVASLRHAWASAVFVAYHLACDSLRAASRARIALLADLDSFQAPNRQEEQGCTRLWTLVEDLWTALGRGERETLDLLVAGVRDNAEIASLRGVTLRTVERSRQHIAIASAKEGLFADRVGPERNYQLAAPRAPQHPPNQEPV
jgi:DNA-directed RNA polymerase specialized sigma24 family protein